MPFDSSMPLSSPELIRSQMQGGKAELLVVPQAGDSSNLEPPEFVSDALATFLRGVGD